MSDATFFYFKPSGKWAYSGRGTFSTLDCGSVTHDVIRETNGEMPGVAGNAKHLIVCVIPDKTCDHPYSYPRLIKPVED